MYTRWIILLTAVFLLILQSTSLFPQDQTLRKLQYAAHPNHREIARKAFDLADAKGFTETDIDPNAIRARLEAGAFSEDYEEIPGRDVRRISVEPWEEIKNNHRILGKIYPYIPYGEQDNPNSGWYRGLNHGYDPITGYQWPGSRTTTKRWANDATENSYTWEEALIRYRRGRKDEAYQILGHVMHLLTDLSVPAHVKVVNHGAVVSKSEPKPNTPFTPDIVKIIWDDYETALSGGFAEIPDLLGDFSRAVDAANPLKIPSFQSWEVYFDSLAKYTYNLPVVKRYYREPLKPGTFGVYTNTNREPVDPRCKIVFSNLSLCSSSLCIPLLNGRYTDLVFCHVLAIPKDSMIAMCDSLVPKAVEFCAGLLFHFQAEARAAQVAGSDIALVIDRSGSMQGQKLVDAKTAASTFVGFAQQGDKIGVVNFDCDANVVFPLVAIVSDATKTAIQNAISSIQAGGGTSIAAGIKKAQQELNKTVSSFDQYIVLLTDGREESCFTSEFVRDVLPGLPKTTHIFTVGLGNDIDGDLLRYTADVTGGSFYFAPSSSQLQAIYNFIRGRITKQQTFASFSGSISQGATQTYTATVDGLTKQATFSLTYQGSVVDLELVTPRGRVINASSGLTDTSISYSKGQSYAFYVIRSPEAGRWELRVIGTNVPTPEAYTLSVQGSSTLRMEVFLDKNQYEVGQPVLVSATLLANGLPVIGATVTALVLKPATSSAQHEKGYVRKEVSEQSELESTNSLKLPKLYSEIGRTEVPGTASGLSSLVDSVVLYDDGLHGDIFPNDGVYANYFTNTDKSGNYSLMVKAGGSSSLSGQFTREAGFSTFVSTTSRPPAPSLVSPTNGSTSVSTRPILKWGPSAGATSYRLQVSTSTAFAINDFDSSLIAGTSLIAEGLAPDVTYYWRVNASSPAGMSDWSPVWKFSTSTPTTDGKLAKENIYSYPNPFDPRIETSIIRYSLGKDGNVTIRIYDVANSLVRTLLDSRPQFSGIEYDEAWDGANDRGNIVANGIYFYVIESSSGEKAVGKVAVLR